VAYRNGTYVAFHADGNNLPGGKSDIDYYRLLCAWDANKHHDFQIINTHEKFSAVRDSSKKTTLRNALLERLRHSTNMLLIVGETTREDTDWVPFEIEKAVDSYGIPIIVAYTASDRVISDPRALGHYWPRALATRINDGTARAIHIPFKQAPIFAAIEQFSHNNLPPEGGLVIYSPAAYRSWNIS